MQNKNPTLGAPFTNYLSSKQFSVKPFVNLERSAEQSFTAQTIGKKLKTIENDPDTTSTSSFPVDLHPEEKLSRISSTAL